MKVYVISKRGCLQGVFTNEHKVWQEVEAITDKEKFIYLVPDFRTSVQLTEQKFIRYLNERLMLNIYEKEEELFEYALGWKPKPVIQIWVVETDKHYQLEKRGKI